MFLKNKCSALATCLNQPLSASALRGKSHMAYVVSLVTGFFFLHAVFLEQSSLKNFAFIILLNQSLKVSMVNFNSIKKSSRVVHFCLERTAEAAPFNCLSVMLSKNGACLDLKWSMILSKFKAG